MRERVRLRRARRPGERFRRGGVEDPLSGVASLADLMLVFATGLLVALVLAWDLARALDPSLPGRLRALESAREVEELRPANGGAEESVRGAGGRYRSMGRVFQDTATGKMYVVEEP